jgi:hypothetical protein
LYLFNDDVLRGIPFPNGIVNAITSTILSGYVTRILSILLLQ